MGQYIKRPANFKFQRSFVKVVLDKEWDKITRVAAPPSIQDQTYEWCTQYTDGRWSKTDGGEYFYFEDDADAVHFRLRWTGTDINSQMMET